jgi:hypothetical protein
VGVGTGFALIAAGAALAFTFTGEILGLDVDVVGALMIAGAVAVVLALIRGRRRPDYGVRLADLGARSGRQGHCRVGE